MTRAELAAGLALPVHCLDGLNVFALAGLERLHRAGIPVACTEPRPGYRLYHYRHAGQSVTCTAEGLPYTQI